MRYVVFKIGQFFVKPIGKFRTEREAVEFAQKNRYYVVYDTAEHAIVESLRDVGKRHLLEVLGSDFEVTMFMMHRELETEYDQARIQRYLKKHNMSI